MVCPAIQGNTQNRGRAMTGELRSIYLKIGSVYIRIDTDSRYLLEIINERFGCFSCSVPEKTFNIVMNLKGLKGNSTIPEKIPSHAVCVHKGYTASYYKWKDRWFFDISDTGRMVIDTVSKSADAWCYESAVKGKSYRFQDFMYPLFELLRTEKTYLYHAASLCIDESGLMLAGRSGRGKSTLSLDLFSKGFGFMSDDRCFLERSEKGFDLFGFIEPVRVFPRNVSHIPCLQGIPDSIDDNKVEIDIRDYCCGSFVKNCSLNAILFPYWEPSSESGIKPVSQAKALLELLPLTMECVFEDTSREHFRFNCELTSKILMAELILGHDRQNWHRLVRDFVKSGVTA